MKTRFLFTLIIISVYALASATWGNLRSPVAGATTAAQLDDTVQSWMLASIVRNNFVEHLITAACVVLLLIVWLVRAKNKTNDQ